MHSCLGECWTFEGIFKDPRVSEDPLQVKGLRMLEVNMDSVYWDPGDIT